MDKTSEIKQLADSYVANLRQMDSSSNADRWFPQHEDETIQKVRWFHGEMGKLLGEVR